MTSEHQPASGASSSAPERARPRRLRLRRAYQVWPLALASFVGGIGCLLWAFGLDQALWIGLSASALIAVIGLWLLIRPPALVTLDDRGIRVRRRRATWPEVTGVEERGTQAGPALRITTSRAAADPLWIPLRWLAPGDADRLDVELRQRIHQTRGIPGRHQSRS